jgi:hypothetical protein
MTVEEFNKTKFGKGDKAVYKNETYSIAALDFEEKLIGLHDVCLGADEDDITWVRCENIVFVQLDKQRELLCQNEGCENLAVCDGFCAAHCRCLA